MSKKGEISLKSMPLSKEKLTAGIFIGTVVTVLVAVTEKSLVNADGVSACELANLTEGLVGAEKRLHLSFLGQLVTVLHSPLPITRLLLQIEGETRRTSDGLQALSRLHQDRLTKCGCLPPLCTG